ncbi:4-hydroxybenzoate octaprenyltransferase [Pelagibacterium xiamenense]|uniref:4-hydroxybenzoate octaprenyltransferase n=1 Tax=Pelagibacterium xiamenense TaxID=2901140 RepID=UPI001E3D2211|nr:4-hydroxybenzoate octaprenyltransferase [Pelagibacterium xiamenense]MCD7059230.1 4-hydroxybenzoate octaprenyltransferase [Pelagibacterium xiamenense]
MSSPSARPSGSVADAVKGNWVDRFAPEAAKPYLRMSRLDRPIGYQLLFWPCAFALAIASTATGTVFNLSYFVLFFIGAVAMRGAGCTFNDIVDRDIDDKVARTRSRPIPSGQVSVKQAAVWLVAQALVGLAVLLQFNVVTVVMGLASLVPVAIYPFMKRVTYWPQLFLGFAFSWGAFVGWTAITGGLDWAPLVLYAATIAWTIGYDTIYALQDVEDDVLIGVKSTALLVGERPRPFVTGFYALAMILWFAAGQLAGSGWDLALFMLAPGAILAWQIVTLDRKDGPNCLARFKANHWVGVALTLAFVAAGLV